MSQNDEEQMNIEEINKFTTFNNPNNFDDYFAKVLPTLSN